MSLINIYITFLFVTTINGASILRNNTVGIFGGHNISIETAPYMALVVAWNFHGKSICGGSIIHEQFILTAAHCINEEYNYLVRVGIDSMYQMGEKFYPDKIYVHDMFDEITGEYDISIIKLNTNLIFDNKVNKIALSTGLEIQGGMNFEVSGWGDTKDNGNISTELQQVTIPMIPTDLCDKIYGKNVTSQRIICAGDLGKGICFGDSGGPLTWNNTHLVGITSSGGTCGILPQLFTKVSEMLPWIINTIDEDLKLIVPIH